MWNIRINLCKGSINRKPGRGHISESPLLRRKFTSAVVQLRCSSHLYKHHRVRAAPPPRQQQRWGRAKSEHRHGEGSQLICIWMSLMTAMLIHHGKCCWTSPQQSALIGTRESRQRIRGGRWSSLNMSGARSCTPALAGVKGDITDPFWSVTLTPNGHIKLNGLQAAEARLRNACSKNDKLEHKNKEYFLNNYIYGCVLDV